jgi:excisionase family DNA binding protein
MPRAKVIYEGVAEYMPIAEIQKYLGITPDRIIRKIRRGDLTAIKIGKGKGAVYRVRRDSFNEFFKNAKKGETNQTVSEVPAARIANNSKFELLTTQDIAQCLAVHGGTVTRLIIRGALHGIKLGSSRSSHYRVRREDFEKFLEETAVKN